MRPETLLLLEEALGDLGGLVDGRKNNKTCLELLLEIREVQSKLIRVGNALRKQRADQLTDQIRYNEIHAPRSADIIELVELY